MIISFKHKFIFVHLGRTGGRSLTEGLMAHCGANDIITPVGDLVGRNHRGWHRHESARSIRNRLGKELFDEFFVFTVDRNPWDKVLSNFWAYQGYSHGQGGATEQISSVERLWRKVSGYPWTFDRWLKYRQVRSLVPGKPPRFPISFCKIADESGNVIVDEIYRYENIQADIQRLSNRLGLPIEYRQTQGAGTRRNRSSYITQYSLYGKQLIERVFAQEIELLGYAFEDGIASVPLFKHDRSSCHAEKSKGLAASLQTQ